MLAYFKKAREPMNSYTHFLGIIFAVAATIFLASLAIATGETSPLILASVLIFGASMLALYSASSFYHYYNGPQILQDKLRKLDHSMIFVLIAGTYTPICLKFMPLKSGLIFITFIWAFALIGILIKMFWMNAPRWLYTSVYLLMGWAIIFDWKDLAGIPGGAFALLLAGGISYSVGAIFYIFKKPNFLVNFGFHELFHICILAGTFFHFLAVLIYVVL